MTKYKIRITSRGYRRYNLFIDGELINTTELAEKLKISRVTVHNAIASRNKGRIVDWMMKYQNGVKTVRKIYWHGCDYQFLEDVTEHVGVGSPAAGIRLKKWVKDGDTDELFRPIAFQVRILKAKRKMYETREKQKTKPEKAVVSTLKIKRKKFNRTDVCLRDRGTMKCKHYDSCNNYRIYNSGKFHPRQLKDGSCYDGVRIKPSRLEGQGQYTDSIQRTVNYF